MPDPSTVTAALVIIGNEILSGRTRDANLPFLAEKLNALGIRLREVRVVADDEGEIIASVNALRARFDYVFTTGGIGPTHDDITSQSVARAFDLPLVEHPEAVRRLVAHYGTPDKLNEARRRMTRVPEGASLIDNPISAAPGFRIDNVMVMAGIPAVMQAMFAGIAGTLKGGAPMLTATVGCGLAEGQIAADLGRLQDECPTAEIGSYPVWRDGKPAVNLVVRGTDRGEVANVAEAIAALVRRHGGTPVVVAP